MIEDGTDEDEQEDFHRGEKRLPQTLPMYPVYSKLLLWGIKQETGTVCCEIPQSITSPKERRKHMGRNTALLTEVIHTLSTELDDPEHALDQLESLSMTLCW